MKNNYIIKLKQMNDREIIQFTQEMDLDKEISNGSVLVCFYADWCKSCKILNKTRDNKNS
jgi:thiol:disulfide interchange protein